MMSGKLKVGVCGTGNMGRNHLRVLSTMAEIELVGCFDANPDAAEQQAGLYDIMAFSSQEELFDAVEVVHIVVPSFLHEECAVAAAQAGCHVLVEKPIALTLDSCPTYYRRLQCGWGQALRRSCGAIQSRHHHP